jgi:transcription elongation factor Elf1
MPESKDGDLTAEIHCDHCQRTHKLTKVNRLMAGVDCYFQWVDRVHLLRGDADGQEAGLRASASRGREGHAMGPGFASSAPDADAADKDEGAEDFGDDFAEDSLEQDDFIAKDDEESEINFDF